MMQRPGCFIFVVIAAFVVLGVAQNYLRTVTEAAPVVAQSVWQPSASPSVSATVVDTLATQSAAGRAADTQRADTATAEIKGTAAMRTATADAWTATAVQDLNTLVAAVKTDSEYERLKDEATVTAIPTAEAMTREAHWATANARETDVLETATVEAREAGQAAVVDDAMYWAQVVLICGAPVAIIAGLVMGAAALSWRIKGEAGGKAQAAVVAAEIAGRTPIPTTQGGRETQPLDPHTRTERLAIRALGRMAAPDKGGPDATALTSAPVFGDNRTRDAVRDALIRHGLARSENGVGVELLDGWTVGTLAEAIAAGEVTLDDPPTLAA